MKTSHQNIAPLHSASIESDNGADSPLNELNTNISDSSLSQKVIRGGLWVFALRIISRGLGFIRTIILARLLSPNDFGLMGIAMLAISTLETFSQTGFQAALIQKKEDIQPYLDTAWTLSAIRGCLLFLILFFGAPWIALFFNSPNAKQVIQVVAFLTLLGGLNNIGVVFFQKELDFNKKFIYEISSTVADLIVSVTLVFIMKNVWALVWGGLTAGLVRLLMSYQIHSFRPNLTLCREKASELFRFGKWITGTSILIFIATQGDDIIVGKIFGAAALGIYQMAYLISNMPATEITHVISQLTFPAYSKIYAGGESLKKAFLLTLNIISAFSFPLVILTILLIPEFTVLFLGEKWHPIIWPSRVLAIAGGIRAISAAWGSLYLSTGNPKYALIKNSWRVLLTFLPMLFLARIYGINGIALSVLSGITAALVFDFWYLAKTNKVDIDFKDVTIILLGYMAALLPASLAAYWFKKIVNQNDFRLLFAVVAFVVTYIICLTLLSRIFNNFPFQGFRLQKQAAI